MDPFLGICCLAKELKTEGAVLLDLIERQKLEKIAGVHAVEKGSGADELMSEAAQKIYERAQVDVVSIPYKRESPYFLFLQRYAEASFRDLEGAFPETTWKSAIDGTTLSLFTRCSKEKADEIAAELGQRGIPFKITTVQVSSEYLILIPDALYFTKRDRAASS
jgi:hypothetical protein